MSTRAFMLALLVTVLSGVSAAGDVVILGEGSYWRVEGAPPPEGWQAPDFDGRRGSGQIARVT